MPYVGMAGIGHLVLDPWRTVQQAVESLWIDSGLF
jgi:hypothetical protein